VERLKGHVKNPQANEHSEERFEAPCSTIRHDADQESKDEDVHQPFGVLAIVDGAYPRYQTEDES
jgi:hypothetical protein